MKKLLLICLLIVGIASLSRASVTINLNAATLYAGNTSTPMPTGGLVQLVVSTTDNIFSMPTPGSFTGTSSDDIVLLSFVINDLQGTPGSLAQVINFNLGGNLNAGDFLMLRWFPSLTIANAGTGPGAGNAFGQFRTDTVQDASDIAWVVPNDGSLVFLNLFTVSQGGSVADALTVANMVVVPEPSTYALLLVGLVGVAVARRRVKQTA